MIAALFAWHERHEVSAEALATVTALRRGSPARRFADPPLLLDVEQRAGLLARLAGAGVAGGATYDGLVALEAAAHGETLLTLDDRAQPTYRRLGAGYRSV